MKNKNTLTKWIVITIILIWIILAITIIEENKIHSLERENTKLTIQLNQSEGIANYLSDNCYTLRIDGNHTYIRKVFGKIGGHYLFYEFPINISNIQLNQTFSNLSLSMENKTRHYHY